MRVLFFEVHGAMQKQGTQPAEGLSNGAEGSKPEDAKGPAAAEDDDIDLGPGMFDEEAADMMSVGRAGAPKSIADMVAPWGGYSGGKTKASKLKSTFQTPHPSFVYVTFMHVNYAIIPSLLASSWMWVHCCHTEQRMQSEMLALWNTACTCKEESATVQEGHGTCPLAFNIIYNKRGCMCFTDVGVDRVEKPDVVEERKLPKALLQQHCQKRQWPPPRFERLPPGGQCLAAAGIRYSISLDMPPPNGRKKKVPSSFRILQLVPL